MLFIILILFNEPTNVIIAQLPNRQARPMYFIFMTYAICNV